MTGMPSWDDARQKLDTMPVDTNTVTALRESETHYRSIFEHPTDFMMVLEAVRSDAQGIDDWRFVDVNGNTLRVLNRSREQVVGRRLSEIAPDRAERLGALCAGVLQTGTAHHYETTFGTQDYLVCLLASGDRSVIASGTDVTARNRAECEVRRLLDALRSEKEWLFAALNSISDEVYFTDAQKRYLYANPVALREFGHRSVSGVPVEDVVADLVVLRPDGSPRPIEEAPPLRALAGEVIKDEGQIVRVPRTGEFRHRQVSSAPVRDANLNIIGSVSIVRDVTESKHAEARLHAAVEQARAAESESRAALASELAAMKRLHELSTIAITTNDQQALLEEILDATIELHGAQAGIVRLFDPESDTLQVAAHRSIDPLFLDEFAAVGARIDSVCREALLRNERLLFEDIEDTAEYGIYMDFATRIGCRSAQSTPMITTDGTPIGMLSTYFAKPRKFSQDELRLTDLYARQAGIAIERMRAQQALIAAREAADRANTAKSHFVRAASHDLRQSVQTLAMLNACVRNSSMDEPGQAALRQQEAAVETMAHLLDALLNISKLESGSVRPEIVDFPIAPLFDRLHGEFAAAAAAKGLTLEVDAPTASIHSDPTLVGEILRNLLANAIKFTSQGSIWLRCESGATTVRVEVGDTGIGIAREELSRIFDEFYQVGVSATVSREGHGLGLGIVQRMAALLNADINVESEIGVGSRFSLTVGAGRLTTAEQSVSMSPSTADRPGKRGTLLLVEDDPLLRSSMELFLKMQGYRVVSAATADETAAVVSREPQPELLITDFHLPGGRTGSEVAATVRETLGVHFPIIMISGDTSSDIQDLPHDAHLRFAIKPVEPDNLVALVQEMLQETRRKSHDAIIS